MKELDTASAFALMGKYPAEIKEEEHGLGRNFAAEALKYDDRKEKP